MALYWSWKTKCGEATFRRELSNGETREFTVNLYEGNAFLIFIYEYKEDGRDVYNVQGFFVDKDHMKRCLGIDKKDKESYGHNIYDKPNDKLVSIRLNKTKMSHFKDIITAFTTAFDNINIEIYTEEEE